MARWLRPNRDTSSGISGGTAKKVTPTAKKLTTVEARINHRRGARSFCMARIIQAPPAHPPTHSYAGSATHPPTASRREEGTFSEP